MVRAAVLDIEGTTSTIASVHDQLFPYARERLAARLHDGSDDVADVITLTRDLVGRPDAGVDEIVAVLLEWSDRDMKATPLKTLQGLIWADGFAGGQLRGHVYPDVPVALSRWRKRGLRLAVYSSGSVAAQRDWFAHTDHGDLSGYFAGFFDTRNPGPKTDPASYLAIGRALELPNSDVLFLSDARHELDAARTAGLPTVGVRRPADGSPDTGDHPCVSDFNAVPLLDPPTNGQFILARAPRMEFT